MRSHRRSKRWLSGWLMVVLLFTQLLTSAYACPTIAAATSAPIEARMPGCDGNMPGTMDSDQQQLCQAHCSQGSQTVQSAPGVDAPAVPPLLLAILDWSQTALAPTRSAARMAPLATGAPPPGSPPLYLSLLVLRN